jgi:hypothetical protein
MLRSGTREIKREFVGYLVVHTAVISLIVLALIIAGALLGAFARTFLSEEHLNAETKDVIKMSVGLIATLSALVLGLLIATGKTSFDAKVTQVRQIAANAVLLDQTLAQYGNEVANARVELRRTFNLMVDRIWNENNSASRGSSPFQMTGAADSFIQSLVNLPAATDFQRALKTEIVNIANEVAKGRLSLFVQGRDTISMPFLTILVFWLTVIFGIFGLLTRLNVLVAVIMLLCAVSVSGSIFLILDMNRPFDGMMRIPSAQMRGALPPLSP